MLQTFSAGEILPVFPPPSRKQTFRPLVGKATLGSITAVEFFSDRQLDFLSDHGAYQPYQEEVDSLSPVLRDNPQLHEEVRFWLKDQKGSGHFLQGKKH
ncbi:probable JmjC domain-containing histone demethylation protein 2C [Oncorhynchus keta]|uniref:probable JmjC domain-containing histone demethylation protein 2C n=1 Tax=Oncorhynchus keta TaxID=8018 RepID=UPI00227D58B4|nr:probable JmjC domain-containing histone demethylation protein 2C [Oncorhynchus keta]